MSGFVYFVGTRQSELVKVGFSESVSARIAEMQIGCPERLHLYGKIAGPVELERRIHAAFGFHRAHGEWFEREPVLRFLEAAKVDPDAAILRAEAARIVAVEVARSRAATNEA